MVYFKRDNIVGSADEIDLIQPSVSRLFWKWSFKSSTIKKLQRLDVIDYLLQSKCHLEHSYYACRAKQFWC